LGLLATGRSCGPRVTALTGKDGRTFQATRRTHNTVLRRTFLATTLPPTREALQQPWQRLSSTEPGAGEL
jgi:hypothetical protein